MSYYWCITDEFLIFSRWTNRRCRGKYRVITERNSCNWCKWQQTCVPQSTIRLLCLWSDKSRHDFVLQHHHHGQRSRAERRSSFKLCSERCMSIFLSLHREGIFLEILFLSMFTKWPASGQEMGAETSQMRNRQVICKNGVLKMGI